MSKTYFHKLVVLGFLGQKNENGKNFGFSKYCEKWKHGMFLSFWTKLHQYKNTSKNCFFRIFFFSVWLKPS